VVGNKSLCDWQNFRSLQSLDLKLLQGREIKKGNRSNKKVLKRPVSAHKLKELESALEYLDPYDRDQWLEVGMALHSMNPDNEELFELWDDWSQGEWEGRADTKYREGECRQKWAGFTQDKGLTIDSIFYLAKQEDWDSPQENKITIRSSKPKSSKPLADDSAGTLKQWGKFIPTDDQVAEFMDPQWILPNFLVQGHILGIAAPPGAGKTALMFCLAAEIAKKREVFYVMADSGNSDIKRMHEAAKVGGFNLVVPNLVAGSSMSDIVNDLYEMADAGEDYSDQVFIFDTFKKMVDAVLDKREVSELLSVLRALTMLGLSIVLLSHTNKYVDEDGNLVFEGTQDYKSDIDDLIYLYSDIDAESKTGPISTVVDKSRGVMLPLSWQMTNFSSILPCDYVDVRARLVLKAIHARDMELIIDIGSAINYMGDGVIQRQIIEHLREETGESSRKKIVDCLRKWTGKHWDMVRAKDSNGKHYSNTDRITSYEEEGD